jgi:hypothetical protein
MEATLQVCTIINPRHTAQEKNTNIVVILHVLLATCYIPCLYACMSKMYLSSLYMLNIKIITPRACARGKVVGSVRLSVRPSVRHHKLKIARYKHLGINFERLVTTINLSDEVVNKLASLCFKSFGKVHEDHKHCIFIGHTYRLYPPCTFCSCAQPTIRYREGSSAPGTVASYQRVRGVCALQSSSYILCGLASLKTFSLNF